MTAQETRAAPMSILVVGLGVIGTTYGYLFQKAGHHAEHLVWQSSTRALVSSLKVKILNGRSDPKGSLSQDQYTIHHRGHTSYGLIVVSVSQGRIAEAVATLRTGGIEGPVLLFCGFWGERKEFGRLMIGRDVLLGYPVAGGSITGERPTCCVFDHVMLERHDGARFPGYKGVEALLGSCGISLEHPHDMLEWIWLYMAINAGVGTVAAMYGDIKDTAHAAEQLMDSTRMLARVVKVIREASKTVASHGVDLRCYRSEMLVYRLPTAVSAPLMKRMFARNLLTRRIMTLYGNTADLLFVYRTVHEQGRIDRVSTLISYRSYEAVQDKATRHDQHLPGMVRKRNGTA